MSIIRVPAKLVKEIKFLQEDDVYEGEFIGICMVFSYVTPKMLNDSTEEYNDSFFMSVEFKELSNCHRVSD